MASEKPTRILLSKTDMIASEVKKLSDAEAWSIIYSNRAERDDRLQICFTGFGKSKKETLKSLIESSGKFRAVSSVTKSLDFLVGGEHAGPIKIEKAEKQGVQFLTENQYIHLIKTGETPEE